MSLVDSDDVPIQVFKFLTALGNYVHKDMKNMKEYRSTPTMRWFDRLYYRVGLVKSKPSHEEAFRKILDSHDINTVHGIARTQLLSRGKPGKPSESFVEAVCLAWEYLHGKNTIQNAPSLRKLRTTYSPTVQTACNRLLNELKRYKIPRNIF